MQPQNLSSSRQRSDRQRIRLARHGLFLWTSRIYGTQSQKR